MSEIKDGGPAFPRNILDHGHGVTTTHESGMTLRDYFAAKALQSFMVVYGTKQGHLGDMDDDVLAEAAYATADAMLTARGQE
jgi:hypothetical protein